MRVVVLGCGRVGQAMVRDLAGEGGWRITAADVAQESLDRVAGIPGVTAARTDLGEASAVAELIAGHDLAVGAVPGPMGLATLRTVIEAGVDVVDISFFEEDPFQLQELAVERGVTAVMDCGIAPGFSNLVLGHAEAVFDRVDRFQCLVGGLPEVREWPYEYRAVFSPIDVIAEYTRPARLVERGREVVREALSEVEPVDLPGVGTLEAFNSDGLRTLLRSSAVPDMKEKTLRYPGHADRMRMLRETGFFGEQPIVVNGVAIRPIDVTARLLFPAWQLPEGEGDLTVMRIDVDGVLDGRPLRRRWELFDRFDHEACISSMARTTGYTCTSVVCAVASGLYREPGLVPPEILGRVPGVYDFVVERLAERGVVFSVSDLPLEPEP